MTLSILFVRNVQPAFFQSSKCIRMHKYNFVFSVAVLSFHKCNTV